MFGNNNLSTVVLTQKIRCAMIPNINKTINVYKKVVFHRNENNRAAKTVNNTSTTAIPCIWIECTPLPGFPNIFLYLHKFIYNTFIYYKCVIVIQSFEFVVIVAHAMDA